VSGPQGQKTCQSVDVLTEIIANMQSGQRTNVTMPNLDGFEDSE